jgi:lactate permease
VPLARGASTVLPGSHLQPAAHLAAVRRAWAPWLLLSVVVFVWGLPQVKSWILLTAYPGPIPDGLVQRVPPVAQAIQSSRRRPSFRRHRHPVRRPCRRVVLPRAAAYGAAFRQVRPCYHHGDDVHRLYCPLRRHGWQPGAGFARTGPLYPFFAALLGWLGVAITGSDTSSMPLAKDYRRTGLDPAQMAAANAPVV